MLGVGIGGSYSIGECGRFSKVHVSNLLPDPGAFDSCMHTFPENNNGFAMVKRMLLCIVTWDLRPSMLLK